VSGSNEIDPRLLEVIVCPRCHASLRLAGDASTLTCESAECALVYPVRDGIPVLLIDDAEPSGASD
jgi:uncharacterized protein YbaR (Trm112 family)